MLFFDISILFTSVQHIRGIHRFNFKHLIAEKKVKKITTTVVVVWVGDSRYNIMVRPHFSVHP